MRFVAPIYLLLLVPLAAGLWLSFRHVHGMARGRKRFAFAVRFLLASLLILALAGPEARRRNEGLTTIFLLDRSDSVSDVEKARSQEFVDRAVRAMGPKDLVGVVAFGKDALVDAAPGGKRALGKVASAVDGSASDLAAAIRLATASFPEGRRRRIVVLSDGNETLGDAAEAAEVAATEGIPIDHVPLGIEDRRGEAAVVGLEAPNEVRADQPFDVRVQIESTVAQDGTLQIDRDGVIVSTLPVRLEQGRNAIVVPEKLSDPGFHRYRATLATGKDRDSRNNIGAGFVAVKGKPRLLVLQQSLKDRSLAQALQRNGISVDLGGPGSAPTRPETLQKYDAVILNDFAAASLTDQQMRMMQSAIRDSGVGFAMVGGENSFLPGGYYGTPIAEALPVDLNIRQRKVFPSASILIIIDCSGSMGAMEDGVVKLRLAAKAAEETVKLLSPLDRVGVAGSTDGIEFVAPMQPLSDKPRVIAQIRTIDITGGGIFIGPSVEAAEKVIRAEQSKVRHLIIMGDGSDSTDFRDAVQRVAKMRADKITTSVIAIGDGKDVPDLKVLAAAGGGRFYLAKKASQLPALVTQDTAVMSRSAIEEGAFIPKLVYGEEVLRGIDSTPPLYAYCLTDTRPLSRVGMRTKKDDPLLATWQYGLGTSLAFTSDAQTRWASQWVGWPGFGAFWSQAARAVSRRATLNNYQVGVTQDGGKGRIEVKAFDKFGNPLPATNAKVRVSTPSGRSQEVGLTQEAPGVYGGSFETGELGSYIVTVAEPDPRGGQRVSSSGFSNPYPAEYRAFRANRGLLQRISDSTSGKAIQDATEALRPVPKPGESIQELWSMFLFLAALLLPFDVAVRRIALPVGEMLAKVWARVRQRPAREVPQAVVVGRLHQAKQRARKTADAAEPVTPVTVEPKQEAPRPAVPRSSSPAATSLLEAKRKRKEDGGSD
jgi:uncharacterized membrane protein